MMHSSIRLLVALAAITTAKTIVINVGQSGLIFSPDTTTASVGDILEFHFFGTFHTAVQGDFSTPCQMGSLVASGFDSGPISNKADGSGNVFQVVVQDTNPIWFYCSTTSHCQSGMAGVVNPPSSGNSLATYKANAAGTSSSQSVGKVQGGVVVPAGGAISSSSPIASPSPSPQPTTPVSSPASQAAPTTLSTPGSSSVSSAQSASSAPGSTTSAATTSTSANSSSSPNASSVPSSSTSAAPVSTSPNSSSSSTVSLVSGSATSSALITPTLVSTSRGGSLMEMTGKTVLLSLVFGLGVVVVITT